METTSYNFFACLQLIKEKNDFWEANMLFIGGWVFNKFQVLCVLSKKQNEVNVLYINAEGNSKSNIKTYLSSSRNRDHSTVKRCL